MLAMTLLIQGGVQNQGKLADVILEHSIESNTQMCNLMAAVCNLAQAWKLRPTLKSLKTGSG